MAGMAEDRRTTSMLNNIYIVSDTHGSDIIFDHPNDILIHLGDYESGDIQGFKSLILIKGNHDMDDSEIFDLIVDGMIINHALLTHEPVERLPKSCHINIHGHLHGNNYEDYGYLQKPFHRLLAPNILYKLDEIK